MHNQENKKRGSRKRLVITLYLSQYNLIVSICPTLL